MTAEGVQAAAKAAKQMTLQEAEMILGTEAGAPWSEVLKVWMLFRCFIAAGWMICQQVGGVVNRLVQLGRF